MNKPQIYTSYFSKIAKIKKEFNKPFLINIARYIQPAIQQHVHYSFREFMPSFDLLKGYKEGNIGEDEYKEIYLRELEEQFDDIGTITHYIFAKEPEMYDGIFLLCYEKSDNFCHRHILREHLNNLYNLGIKEYI